MVLTTKKKQMHIFKKSVPGFAILDIVDGCVTYKYDSAHRLETVKSCLWKSLSEALTGFPQLRLERDNSQTSDSG